VAAARVSRRERKWVRGKERSSQPRGKPLFLHLSMDEEGPLHDRRCPVPADEDEAATHRDTVLSTVEQKKIRGEKTFLPLAGKQNHGGTTAPHSPLHKPPNHHIA
jgi:hypothetical protein